MRSFVQRLCVVLIFSILSVSIFAQEKTQYYYSTHENEILPDANTAFQRGDYDRTIELCKWFYIIVGSHSADSLRNKAERCASLKEEMESFRAAGKTREARDIAKTILSINPSDILAKEVSLIPDPPKPETLSLSKRIPNLISQSPPDTVVNAMPEVSLALPPEEEIISYDSKKETPVGEIVKQNAIRPETEKWPYTTNGINELHNCFVVKAGISLYNWKDSVYPSVSMGIYDIGGSRSGIEMGLDILQKRSRSYYSAAYVFRVIKHIYPKLYLGIVTQGGRYEEPFIGLGTTFFLGKCFCLEVSARCGPDLERFTPSIKVGLAF